MTIELGQISGTLPPAHPAPPRLPIRGPRLAALLLLLLLLPLVGGEQPLSGGVPQAALPAGGDQEAVVVGGAVDPAGVPGYLLLATEPAGQADALLTARRLPGLDLLWSVPSPYDAERNALQIVPAADVLLVARLSRYGQPEETSLTYDTVALAQADGTTRWQRPGAAVAVTRAGPVLFHDYRAGTAHSIDPGSGRVHWSAPLAEQAWLFAHEASGSTPDVWIQIDRGGARVEVRDLRSNRLLGSRTVVLDAEWPQFRAVGDVLLLGDDHGAMAYGLPDLEPRWRLGWRSDEPYSEVSGCGATACLIGDADGLRALDPQTGAVRWSSPRWRLARPAGEFVLVFEHASASPPWVGQAFLVDPATGRLVGDLGAWLLLGSPEGRAPMVGTKRISDGRIMVAVLDADGGPELLGIVDESPGGCARHFGAITCRRFDGSQVVLMVPDEHRSR